MKLVSYFSSEQIRLGALSGDFIVDLNRAHIRLKMASGRSTGKLLPSGMVPWLQGGKEAFSTARETLAFVEQQLQEGSSKSLQRQGLVVPASAVTLAAPVPRPPKLIALWVNYAGHGQESAVEAPKSAPLFFTKFSTAAIGTGQAIILPRISQKVDYEAELALVIGTRGKDIPAEKAYEHVAGYTILNDVSARDFSLKALIGVVGPSDVQKSFDTFAPMGPHLVTADEVPDPHALPIQLRIGEELLQDSNTGFMIHRIPEIIAYISAIATLEPGDVIATGTPPGVGFTRTPPRWLRSGETVRIEIEKIGVLENPVVAES